MGKRQVAKFRSECTAEKRSLPTVYALLEPEHERFAEFGAWFTFNQINGTLDQFRRIHPALYTFYGEKLRNVEAD